MQEGDTPSQSSLAGLPNPQTHPQFDLIRSCVHAIVAEIDTPDTGTLLMLQKMNVLRMSAT